MKIALVGDRTIRQFVVEKDGVYAWRSNLHGSAGRWFFGLLKVGDKIDGQFEGCGPLEYVDLDD